MMQQKNFKTSRTQETPRQKLWIRIVAYFIILCFVAQDAAFSISIPQYYSAPIVVTTHLNLLSLLTKKAYAGGSDTTNVQSDFNGKPLQLQHFSNKADLPAPVKVNLSGLGGGAKTPDKPAAAGTGIFGLAAQAGNGVMSHAAAAAKPYVAAGTSAYNAATNPNTWDSAANAASRGLNKLNEYLASASTQTPKTPAAGFTPTAPAAAANPNTTPAASTPAATTTTAPVKFQPSNNDSKFVNSYEAPKTITIQPYRLPTINTTGNLKPLAPVFIQPYKMTALNNGLPNNYTALKPMQLRFIKMEQISPKLIQPALLKSQSIKLSAIKPLNLPLDTKLTKITQIPITMPKLAPTFNTIKPLAFTKITQPEPIKIKLGQLNPALNYSLKPVFNPIKPVTPTMSAIDPKLTKMPTLTIMPLPKFNTTSFTSLNKQAFMPIKQPEPIKAALGKLNPYFIKDQSVLSPIKPNFTSIVQNLPVIRPEIIKINQFDQTIKPEFTKIGQPALNIVEGLSPTNTPLIPIKPNLISIDGIKPLNIPLDKNMTKIPVIATPKFIPADFSAVTKPAFPVMKQPEPIKAALGKLNPAFNNELKPAFSPIKNPITAPVIQPAPIKPQWIKASVFDKPIKAEPNKLKQAAPALVQAVPIKPDFGTTPVPKQIPLAMPLIEKPEIAIKELPIPQADFNNISATFEKIKDPLPLVQAKLPEIMPQILESPVSDTAKILISENKTIVPAVNLNTFDIAKNNMLEKKQLDALKPKAISLVDNYMGQLKIVYEWQKTNKELAYLSRNAEVIAENETSVELAGLNEKIAKTKVELDKKAPEVKEILAKNLVEPSLLENNEKAIKPNVFPVKEMPVQQLPQSLPTDRALPINPPALLPQSLPKPEGGFMPGLRAMFKANVFAITDNRYAELIDADLENIARLRTQ